MQLVVGGNPIESLDDVQPTEVGLDGDLLAARELAGDGQLAADEGLACMHVAVDCLGKRCETFEVSPSGAMTMSTSFVPRTTPHAPTGKTAD